MVARDSHPAVCFGVERSGRKGMAQRTVLVCDVCGSAPAETVTFRVSERNLQKEFCARHLDELLRGARTPRRGRKPKAITATGPARKRPAVTKKRTSAVKRASAKKRTRSRS